MLGNHTAHHLSFNNPNNTLAMMEQEMLQCDAVIRALPGYAKYFRYPYLKEGDTLAKRDGFRSFLQGRGYRPAPVSVDASDWAYNQRLVARLKTEPGASLQPFREAYLAHIWDRAQYYDQLSNQVLGRSVQHVLLLHHNLINALFLDDLIQMFRQRGWQLVSARAAFQDPVYAMVPAGLPAGESILWALARAKGIRFIPYSLDRKPVITKDGDALLCEIYERNINVNITLHPDFLVLSPGTVPSATARSLGTTLKVTANEDGFFVETHAKLGPIDFPSQGIFLCGGAHAPKSISESIYQAQGAVARAATILSQENLMAGGVVAIVDQNKCAACLTCVRICPYQVPRIDENFKAFIEPVQCFGCGSCAGECPNKAIQLQHYKDDQVLDKIRGMFREVSE